MMRSSEETKKRILEAATQEFAQYGFTGARVDRIAEKANCNKSMLYSYFVDKETLFQTVFLRGVVSMLERSTFTAEDLPGYSARLSEQIKEDKSMYRLSVWDSLERESDALEIEELRKANEEKLEKIRAAQNLGIVTEEFTAPELLAIVHSISTIWESNPKIAKDIPLERQKQVIARIIQNLTSG